MRRRGVGGVTFLEGLLYLAIVALIARGAFWFFVYRRDRK